MALTLLLLEDKLVCYFWRHGGWCSAYQHQTYNSWSLLIVWKPYVNDNGSEMLFWVTTNILLLCNWIYSLSNNSAWMGIPVSIFTFISVCSTFHNSILSFQFLMMKFEVFYLKVHYTLFYNKIYWNLWSIILNIKYIWFDLGYWINPFFFLFSADSETPYLAIPSHHSDSVKERVDFLDLAQKLKVERKPRVRERRSQAKTQVCFSNIFLLIMLVIACTALAESVRKWVQEDRNLK